MRTHCEAAIGTGEHLDVSALSGIARKTLIDFYHFLLAEHSSAAESHGTFAQCDQHPMIIATSDDESHALRRQTQEHSYA